MTAPCRIVVAVKTSMYGKSSTVLIDRGRPPEQKNQIYPIIWCLKKVFILFAKKRKMKKKSMFYYILDLLFFIELGLYTIVTYRR